MKKTAFAMIFSILMSNPVLGMGALMFTTGVIAITVTPSVVRAGSMIPKDGKIVITETKGLLFERKDNGDIVELDKAVTKKMVGLSLQKSMEKMDSPNCEERLFATWQCRSVSETLFKVNLQGIDCWDELIRKLLVDLYWTSKEGDYEIGKALASVSLILLEDKVVEYFEKNNLELYEDMTLKRVVMLDVFDSIAKEKKDLIPRIRNIVNPDNYEEKKLKNTAKYLNKKFNKYESERNEK